MGKEQSKPQVVYVDRVVPAPAPAPPPVFESEWRKGINWKGKDAMLKRLKEYNREDEDVKLIRVLLHGAVGSGKSSFINSVSSVLRGRMAHGAHVDAIGGESFTLKYTTHKIKKRAQEYHPFVFNDIMGLEDDHGIKEKDIKLAMKGHVKDNYTFNPVAAISDENSYYNKDPTPEDKVHVLVCIIPADQVAVLSQALVDKIRNIRLKASTLGIPQICVITKIDEVHDFMKKDVKNVYFMKIVKEKMEEFSGRVGIPVNCIFPVKNYHEETALNNDVDVLILEALQNIINFGEDFIEAKM